MKSARQRWMLQRGALAGLSGAALFAAMAIFGFSLLLTGPPPDSQVIADRLLGPGPAHLMGTDQLGRDLASRVAGAVRGSLATAAVVIAISGVGGGLLGIFSAYLAGWLDSAVQRAVDMVMAVPLVVLGLAVAAAFGASFWAITMSIGVAFTPLTLRVTRSSALSLRNAGFIDAARVSGASTARIVLRHITPSVAGPWAVVAASQAGAAVLAEAALAFLGVVPPGRITLGGLMGGEAQTYMYSAPWLVIWPGVAIGLLALSANLAGEWLSERGRRA